MSNDSERERESECKREGEGKKRVINSLFDTCRTFKDTEHKEHDYNK